jgi:nicotinate-nucleotide pyrophosphorylase
MTYTASVHVMGFVPVEVEANSLEEAKKKIEERPDKYATDEVQAYVFNSFETEPKIKR